MQTSTLWPSKRWQVVVKPYTQSQISNNKFERIFREHTDDSELVWHRDHNDRNVKVLTGKGWKVQMDNQLPKEIKRGDEFFIPKETYHRLIKGTGNLKVKIKKLQK